MLVVVIVAGSECLALTAGSLSGVVKDSLGIGLAGSTVWAVTENCLESRRLKSDDRGRYSFVGLPEGTYKVFAVSSVYPDDDGFLQLGLGTVSLRVDGAESLDLELRVSGRDTGGAPPSMPVGGIVTDAANVPIGGVIVTHLSFDHPQVQSDTHGRFGYCRVSGVHVKLRFERQGYRSRIVKLKLDSRPDALRHFKVVLRKV